MFCFVFINTTLKVLTTKKILTERKRKKEKEERSGQRFSEYQLKTEEMHQQF